MRTSFFFSLAAILCAAVNVYALPQPPPRRAREGAGPDRPERPGPDQVRGGPYQHKVLSASSRDGLTWARDPVVRIEHASVPCAVADGLNWTPEEGDRLVAGGRE